MALAGMHIAPRDAPEAPWRVVANVTHTLVNLNLGHYITTHGVEYDGLVTYRPSDHPSTPGRFPALHFPNTELFLNQQFTDG